MPSSLIDININKTKLIENFIDIKNIANINILICYKILLTKESLIYNIGSYLIIAFLLFHIISIIIFYLKDYKILKGKIDMIIYALKNLALIKSKQNKKAKIKIIQKKRKNISKNSKKLKLNKNINLNNLNKTYDKRKNKKQEKNNPKCINLNNNKRYHIKNNKYNTKKIKKMNTINEPKSSKTKKFIKLNTSNKNYEKKIKKINKIMEYTNEEKNLLSYNLALRYDKRSYCVYYISLLKTKHILIFSFFQNNDYNSKIIKIDLFFVSFAIYYTVNCLFFDNNTLHKIYETEGSFNFIYQLPKIIYSSLISTVLNSILKNLALSNDGIINLKEDTKGDIEKRNKKLIKSLNIKFILYFILGFLFLLCFWYYIAMFGAIYKNSQMHLLKDTLISFGLSLIYPFFIYLLPGIFRIPAISDPKKKREYLYDFSKLIQKF